MTLPLIEKLRPHSPQRTDPPSPRSSPRSQAGQVNSDSTSSTPSKSTLAPLARYLYLAIHRRRSSAPAQLARQVVDHAVDGKRRRVDHVLGLGVELLARGQERAQLGHRVRMLLHGTLVALLDDAVPVIFRTRLEPDGH